MSPKSFQHAVCRKTFANISSLFNHVTQCNELKTSENVKQWKNYEKSHSSNTNEDVKKLKNFDKSRFVCLDCNKSFAQKTSLARHRYDFHTGPSSFQCSKCHKKYNTHLSFKRHSCPKAEKKFQCSKCPKQFPHQYRLFQHQKRH